ncbi:MAG TPA: hypothetical protein RMF84_11225 [Polyangiaceae bacterium LLY-WYZ-14_1]|nr:hypothetical protein [Polyangiaceae bacterium LLY-WYZ-14_1]
MLDRNSCGNGPFVSIVIELEEPAVDDLAPPDRISYAVFSGRSAEETQSTGLAEVHLSQVRSAEDGSAADVEAVIVPSRLSRKGGDIWVAVLAMDQAGNISPRTEPFLAHASRGGCGR